MRTPMKRVTIVSEGILERQILEALRRLGAQGYTVFEVRGSGSRGVHASDWEGRNVQIETIVSDEVADRILDFVSANYFRDYALIAYVDTVEVIRGGKYSGRESSSGER